MRREDLTGQRFGKLEVVRYAYTNAKKTYWECRCDCGNVVVVKAAYLKNGATQSCGCVPNQTPASMRSRARIMRILERTINRCEDPHSYRYPEFGARGISVCAAWYDSPAAFVAWAMANGYSDDMELERIDPDQDFCPSNCYWVKVEDFIPVPQRLLEIDGETKTVAEWSEITGLHYSTIYNRHKRGITGQDLLAEPRSHPKHKEDAEIETEEPEPAAKPAAIHVGQKVRFDPLDGIQTTGFMMYRNRSVDGVVTFVNEENGWFLAEFNLDGAKSRHTFHLIDVGKAVELCE